MSAQTLPQGMSIGNAEASTVTMGGQTTNNWILGEIGNIYMMNGKEYIVAQFPTAIPAPAQSQAVSFGLTALGAPDYTNCALSAVVDDWKCFGILPPNQAAIPAKGIALVQISGPAQYLADVPVTAGQLLNSGGVTPGRLSNVSDTEAGVIGVSTSTPLSAAGIGQMVIIRRV